MPPLKFKHFYAVARDGRFLINNAGTASPSPPISMILDPKL
jgi:hypothetical protein